MTHLRDFINSNLFSGFIGAVLGAVGSLVAAIYTHKRQQASSKLERERNNISEALILAGKLHDNYFNYRPNSLNSFGFRSRPEDQQFRSKIQNSVDIYDSSKYFMALLPSTFRKRWDMMLILISEFSNLISVDDVTRNRAGEDVSTYIRYVQNSLQDYLDGKPVRPEFERPYLRREDPESWQEPQDSK